MEKNSLILPEGTLVPNHLAIIPDGNRRWARAKGLPSFEGHRRGFDITPEIARACRNFGVHTLTIWAFSTENWDRSPEEIKFLMKKYEDFVDQHLKEARKEEAKIIHLGRKDRIPPSLVRKITQAEKETENNKKYILNIALDYGGRDEILRATKRILAANLNPDDLDEETFKSFLDTQNQPYPYVDLVIRSSGEQRFSGLLPWQLAYAEFYWLPDHFPEFTPEKLWEAILDFSRRRRRFGGNDGVPKVKFDPKKVGKLEYEWWRAHNEKDEGKLRKFLIEWTGELYSLNETSSQKASEFFIKAVKYHNLGNWSKAIEEMEWFYKFIKEEKEMIYQPKTVAQLEVNWWRIHDELEGNIDKWRLEKTFGELYGEIYRLSDLQTTKMAHLKALATFAYDLADKSKLNDKEEKYWKLAKDYLIKAYLALKEVAS